ncbi:hypothetical protein R6Q59_018034 [Mikania micrantha]
MESPAVTNRASGSSESGGSESGAEEKGSSQTRFEYFGWVYHLGTNSIGREFCHLRFLYIRGKYVMMYKRDPHENPGIKPIRRGVVGNTLMVEELGRRKVNDGDLYLLRFYNRLDEEKKGEIACGTAGETRKWMEAFDQAKQHAEFELSQGSTRNRLSVEDEIDLEGRRPRVRRYAHDLKKVIRIGHGPELLVRRSSNLGKHQRPSDFIEGEKKKQRQDMIASKHREQRISHGVDLEKINFKLEQMVKNRDDMLSFQLMHSSDCSQVQRLAAIYRLQSGSQGSGRKRFLTVTRTRHTCMPSSSDRIRLEKLLGINDEANDMLVGKTHPNRIKKAGLSSLDPKSAKNNESSKKKRRDKGKTGSYAAQPVSFVSSGHMVSEPEKSTMGDHQTSSNNKSVAHSSSYGEFEMHTTGFGSRMMAKMGYVDGGGLGKDGRGISEPIEVIQRPKSLGLGAKIPDTSEAMNATPPPQKPNRLVGQGSSESKGKSGNVQFGSFEKHTKGFGSKMMAKMGFVEGMGLGRDSQGIVQPLVASRLPKSRGLGAKG